MNWWEETESRARRSRGGAALALVLQNRLLSAGMDPELAALPAFDLARLHGYCCDLVLLVDGLLVAEDGDLASVRRQALLLSRWAGEAAGWSESSASAFNALMDRLEIDPQRLQEREEGAASEPPPRPEESAKLEGRYRHYHLLFERLDLKLAACGLEEQIHRSLARSLARLYEEALITIRLVTGVEREAQPRLSHLARTLLELNTTWHFDLGPNHLAVGPLRPGVERPYPLPFLLLLAFSNPGFSSGTKP